jgi:hypothetical protein
MMQLNGVQMNTKFGMDFNTQYSVPDTGLTNNTTLTNNPLYNLLQVVFQNKQSDNIEGYNKNDLFNQTGLNPNIKGGWIG